MGKRACLVPIMLILTMPAETPARLWGTLYMDDEEQCGGTSRNDDMEEGDVYYVKSQNGWNKDARRPAECSQNFNFGDRFISLRIVEWRCDKTFENLFLAVYDNCYGTRSHLKILMNCSQTPSTHAVHSSGSCLYIYHYRGHIREGYSFEVEVIAMHEIIAFPAGGIAAIIIGSMASFLVILKIVCAITGWEDRLPKVTITQDDTKGIYSSTEGMVGEINPDVPDTQAESSLVEPDPSGESCQTLLEPSERRGVMTSEPQRADSDSEYGFYDGDMSDYDNVEYPWRTRRMRFTSLRTHRTLKL